ncbi:unnamed protein product [Plutella xylostella]|uniref:(diamondback moth) hypothetical protein n=1 Tax=Plutella xylostella TaxID=51655 RepID=A0A8S4G5U8_PLUXY|nr:unnamed protein product [Plutella xylostella]
MQRMWLQNHVQKTNQKMYPFKYFYCNYNIFGLGNIFYMFKCKGALHINGLA